MSTSLSSEIFPNVAKPAGLGKPKPKRPAPLSVRLTEQQKAKLKQNAAGFGSVNAYVIQKLFGESAAATRRLGRAPQTDQKALAQVLGALGQSRLSQNMNQIAKAANAGVLPVSSALETELSEACDSIQAMRRDLMDALGMRG